MQRDPPGWLPFIERGGVFKVNEPRRGARGASDDISLRRTPSQASRVVTRVRYCVSGHLPVWSVATPGDDRPARTAALRHELRAATQTGELVEVDCVAENR